MPERQQRLSTAEDFREYRRRLRPCGVGRLLAHLREQGFVYDANMLTTGTTAPFNVFARVVRGAMEQPTMVEDQRLLGHFQQWLMLACNRPERGENWQSVDPSWLGKVGMSKNHRFITTKHLFWGW